MHAMGRERQRPDAAHGHDSASNFPAIAAKLIPSDVRVAVGAL
jgi:hypothetical protein